MPSDLEPQLLKGLLTLLLLHLLAERESYGYEVLQRLHEIGLTGVAAGTVYPALSRLEREKCLTSRLVASEEGPARKYYRPTPTGYKALAVGTEQWRSLVELITAQLSRLVPKTPK